MERKAGIMTKTSISLLEVRGDRVVGLRGDDSEERRSQFAREAEGLQARAYHIGVVIGMSAVTCCSAIHEEGGISFRFATSSDEGFDAKGLIIRGEEYAAHSLRSAVL